ncbi:MAG TPA: DUF1538 domain-containing protein [Firmicutes bacterium]|nr:DUF1538 domain-containing protein [Bacillota bacterium]
MNVIKEGLKEAAMAILPLTIFVLILNFVFLPFSWETIGMILLGALITLIGLFLFLHGTKISLIPMGELIGAYLPQSGSMLLLVLTAFIFIFSVTLADPSVHVMVETFKNLADSGIPPKLLSLLVSAGMGILVTFALLRIVFSIPIRLVLIVGYLSIIVLSYFAPTELVPFFLDSGSISTGPLAVPCIIALGLGTASVLGGKDSLEDGFGLVGIATLGPILTMMIWGVFFL